MLRQNFIVVAQVARGHMKPRQSVGQALGWKVAQEVMEPAQGIAYFPGVGHIFDNIKGLGCADKTEGPPERPAGVDQVVPAIPGQEHPGRFPAAAGPGGSPLKTSAQVLRTSAQVSHDQFRLPKHPGVETLQDEARFFDPIQSRRLPPAHRHQKGVMHVAAAIGLDGDNPALGGEGTGHGKEIIQGLVLRSFHPSAFLRAGDA